MLWNINAILKCYGHHDSFSWASDGWDPEKMDWSFRVFLAISSRLISSKNLKDCVEYHLNRASQFEKVGGKANVRGKYIKDSSSLFNAHQKYNPDLPFVFFKSMELEEGSAGPVGEVRGQEFGSTSYQHIIRPWDLVCWGGVSEKCYLRQAYQNIFEPKLLV